MPQREQVNGGGPKPVSPVFLGEQYTTATRLSGSSNMAPALHHMGWLASLCVCAFLSVWVCVCACGGVQWMPALMQMLAVLKNGSLSPLLSLLVGKVYYGLLVLAVIFFLSRRMEDQEVAPVIHFKIQHY